MTSHQYFGLLALVFLLEKELIGRSMVLDEIFFTHQEEIDLCWRLQLKGGTIKYFGKSTVYHIGGATLSSYNSKKTFYNFRNSLLMLLKNVGSSKIYLLLIIRLILDGLAGLQFPNSRKMET